MTLLDLESKIKRASDEKTQGYHVFSNPVRREVFRELTRLPCSTSSRIARKLGRDVRVVEWHLRILRREGFVDMWEHSRTYYFIPDLVDVADLEFFSLLGVEGARTLIIHIIDDCRELSDISLPKSTLYRYLRKLEDLGLAKREGIRKSYVCPTEKLAGMREKYRERGVNYKRAFLKKVEAPGFKVCVIGEIGYEMKIEITGLERFSMGIFISPLDTALGGV